MSARPSPASGAGGEDPASRSSTLALFTPKLVTILREGYSLAALRADLIAGLTVAIVALPLSTAIAIASGVSPDRGLYAAIIGGFLVSALGGSRFQIGGPAGAFIVLVATSIQTHGLDGFLLAVMLSGLFLMALGALRLGAYVKFIPYPVTVGFTAGIGVIIFASQVKELLGLTLDGPEPGPLVAKLPVLWEALPTLNPPTLALAGLTVGLILTLKRLRPHWPGMLIAIAIASLLVAVLDLPVETINSRFGGIPTGLPTPALPEISWARIGAVLPDAIAFTLLGAIESLLSAVVADSMTGRRHRSNCELVAQGVANIGSALFGGLCVTGTIARTATNVRAGAHGPVAGMVHALVLLLFILVAAPLGGRIPLAALAGVLAILAWNMVDRTAIASLVRSSSGDALAFAATFGLTIFRDLTEAILVGVAIGTIAVLARLSQQTAVETDVPLIAPDAIDAPTADRAPYDSAAARHAEAVVCRISGAFFFGPAATVGSTLDRIADARGALVIDCTQVPFLDSTAARTLEGLARKARRKGVWVALTGAAPGVRRTLLLHGVRPPLVAYFRTIDEALAAPRDLPPQETGDSGGGHG